MDLAVWLVRMKRPPNPPILAATGVNGSFVKLAFLPFNNADADIRPAWAERGKRRNAWNSLSETERRVALRLLKVKMPRQLIAGARTATIADLLGLHREFALKFERRAWAARHPGDR